MTQTVSDKKSENETRPLGITIVAVLMLIFGSAEVITGFRHEFFGLTTAQVNISTYLGVALGLFYFIGGLLILTKKKKAAITAIVFFCGDMIWRIAMIVAGLLPLKLFLQTFSIIFCTAPPAFFPIYL